MERSGVGRSGRRRQSAYELPELGVKYRQLGVYGLWGEVKYEREPIDGGETRDTHSLNRCEAGDLIVNKIFGHATEALASCLSRSVEPDVSTEFPLYRVKPIVTPGFWLRLIHQDSGWLVGMLAMRRARGTSGKEPNQAFGIPRHPHSTAALD